MEQSTITLIVSITGIASTLAVSSMGLYYTAKSRAAPFRQALFSKQLDIVTDIANLQSRIRVFATILSTNDDEHHEEARSDIGEHFRRFSEVEEKASVILPVELWIEVKKLASEITTAIIEFDSQGIIGSATMKAMIARMTKVALLSRMVIGCDELTEQSISLFSSQKEYKRIVNLEISHLEEIHSRVNQ